MSAQFTCDRCHKSSELSQFIQKHDLRVKKVGPPAHLWWAKIPIDLCHVCSSELEDAIGKAESDFFESCKEAK